MNQPSVSPTIVVSAQEPAAAETRLRGRWLFLARVGWIVLTLLILTLSAIALPRLDALAQSICQPGAQCLSVQLTQADLRLLHQLGLSPGFLAAYQVGLDVGTVLIYSVLATLIFWRRSHDRMALFCAYMLVLLGGATYTGLLDYLRPVAPTWYWLVGVLELLAQVSFLTFFLLFPTGRFVPRWTRWGVLVAVLLETHYVFLGDLFHSQVDALDSLGLRLSCSCWLAYRSIATGASPPSGSASRPSGWCLASPLPLEALRCPSSLGTSLSPQRCRTRRYSGS